MTADVTSGRILPSELEVRTVGPGDEEMVRAFLGADRFREIARTGALGRPGEDGLPDITVDQFVDACVQGLLACHVAVGPDGVPATLVYAVAADAHTRTGGVVNAPDTPQGRGYATACAARVLDEVLRDPEVRQIVISVYDWNVPSVGFIERLGFTRTDASQWAELADVDGGDDEGTSCYVLRRADWVGAEALEKRVLDRAPR